MLVSFSLLTWISLNYLNKDCIYFNCTWYIWVDLSHCWPFYLKYYLSGHHSTILNVSPSFFYCMYLLQTTSITSSTMLRTIPAKRTMKKKAVSDKSREDPFVLFPQFPSLTSPYRRIMESWIPASFILRIVRSIKSLNSRSLRNGKPHWLLRYLKEKSSSGFY